MRIEQSELRDAARALLAGVAGADPADAWTQVVEAGFVGISVPEALGGLDQPLAAACWLHMEMGRAVASVPLLGATAALNALAACPPSPARDAAIERALGGQVPAVSLVEGGAGPLLALQGPADATHILVVGPVVALVPRDAVTFTPRPTWDTSRALGEVKIGTIADDWVLARGADAERVGAAFSTALHFAVAADCVGAADAILEQTVAYLQTRRQFDRPLAMFQALKHRCADLKLSVAKAEALLADHLQALEDGSGDPVLLARATKSFCSNVFRDIAEEALQLHGGMGMTEEHPCHLYLKRALLNAHLASSDDDCDVAVGRAVMAAN